MKMMAPRVWQLLASAAWTLGAGAPTGTRGGRGHLAFTSVSASGGAAGGAAGQDAGAAAAGLRGALSVDAESSQELTLEATLGAEVMKLILGKGPTRHHLAESASSKMDLKDAVQRVAGKLPADVQALVRLTSDTKVASNKSSGEFDEESLQKARKILNGMVEGSVKELDAVLIECKEFEERNRGTYGQVTTDLARLGATIADLSRKRVEANEEITSLDATRLSVEAALQKATLQYTTTRLANEAELTIRTNDLAVFNFILELVRCEENFLQLHGNSSNVTGESVQLCAGDDDAVTLEFQNPKVQAKFERMLTPESRRAIQEALGEIPTHHTNLIQQRRAFRARRQDPDGEDTAPETTTVGLPTFTVEKLPVVDKPGKGQWKKCSGMKPNCGLLHDTMSIQWGKFKDLVDELTFEMHQNADAFEELKENLNSQLTMLTDAKTKAMELLAETISGINAATEEEDQKDTEAHELEHEYKKKMRECKAKIEEILFTNVCAVRQVRNAVMKDSEVSPPSKIADCDVANWVAAECSVDCDDGCPQADPYACGGWQQLTREVVVSPNQYGILCPPLETKKKCNQFKCPVDCVMSEWSGWSKCTKDCEGGVQMKTRSVITKAKNGGESCDTGTESRACNTGSCDRNCRLAKWSEWSPCSMACGGGDQERRRAVTVPIRGNGKCPKPDGRVRLQERECNTMDCIGDEICISKQDLIIALDASGSLRESGFEVLRDFTANLTGRYVGTYYGDPKMQIGVALFGNGRVLDDGTIAPAINVVGLTADIDLVKTKIEETEWQRGLTNMAQAFNLADTMLSEGGRAEAQSAVMVISDGKYSFAFATAQQVQKLKDKNVQVFMAPVTSNKGKELKVLRQWASQPPETNFQRIPGLLALEHNRDMFAAKLIAKFCSKSISPSSQQQQAEQLEYAMIHENGYPDDPCGRWTNYGKGFLIEQCMEQARQDGRLAFAFGKGKYAQGECKTEAIEVTEELWHMWEIDPRMPPCPEGAWVDNPYYDTFAIKPTEEI